MIKLFRNNNDASQIDKSISIHKQNLIQSLDIQLTNSLLIKAKCEADISEDVWKVSRIDNWQSSFYHFSQPELPMQEQENLLRVLSKYWCNWLCGFSL